MVSRIFPGLMETPKCTKLEFWPQCIPAVLSCCVVLCSPSCPWLLRGLSHLSVLLSSFHFSTLFGKIPNFKPQVFRIFFWSPDTTLISFFSSLSACFCSPGHGAFTISHFTEDTSVSALSSYPKKGLITVSPSGSSIHVVIIYCWLSPFLFETESPPSLLDSACIINAAFYKNGTLGSNQSSSLWWNQR